MKIVTKLTGQFFKNHMRYLLFAHLYMNFSTNLNIYAQQSDFPEAILVFIKMVIYSLKQLRDLFW